MSIVNIPPTVNDQGNLNVHIDEGCIVPIVLEDENGIELDASSLTLVFKSGTFEKDLADDSNNPEGKALILTPTDVEDITHGANFRVVDETDVNQPVIRWEGKIYKRG